MGRAYYRKSIEMVSFPESMVSDRVAAHLGCMRLLVPGGVTCCASVTWVALGVRAVCASALVDLNLVYHVGIAIGTVGLVWCVSIEY